MAQSQISAVDSRRYRFAYLLRGFDDVPFDLQEQLPRHFRVGLFIPGENPDRPVRSEYPPKLVLLTDGDLRIYEHPAHGEARMIEFKDLLWIEDGKFLLNSWFSLGNPEFPLKFPYPRRDTVVQSFLIELRRRFILENAGGYIGAYANAMPAAFHADRQVSDAELRELDLNERVVARWSQHSTLETSGKFLFKRRRLTGSDCVDITDQRLLWISTRHGREPQPYGICLRYTSIGKLRGMRVVEESGRIAISIGIGDKENWQIPVENRGDESPRKFVSEVSEIMKSLVG